MIYSLIALGYSMVFGILGFINYAHGEIFMLGSFIGWMLLRFAGLNFVVAMVGAMLITALLGSRNDYVAYKPIREKPVGDSWTLCWSVLLGFPFCPDLDNYYGALKHTRSD